MHLPVLVSIRLAIFYHGTKLIYDQFIKENYKVDGRIVSAVAGGVAGTIYRLPAGRSKLLSGLIPGAALGCLYEMYEQSHMAETEIKRMIAAFDKQQRKLEASSSEKRD